MKCQLRISVCQLLYFVKHDITDATIWRFNVEQAKRIIRYDVFNVSDGS